MNGKVEQYCYGVGGGGVVGGVTLKGERVPRPGRGILVLPCQPLLCVCVCCLVNYQYGKLLTALTFAKCG